jgi:uncharacterized protein YndB with AHSA1/START domain
MSTDRIEKQIVLRAPRARVWQALTDSGEFGEWFGARLEGPFVAGGRVTGRITIKGYEHVPMNLHIERVEPQHTFSYRWHPYAIEPETDYSHEPMTLVEFQLQDVPEGTRLSIVESGFDRIPLERRATAYRMNDGGWAAQAVNIERYLSARSVPASGGPGR